MEYNPFIVPQGSPLTVSIPGTNQVTSCGGDIQCVEVKRTNVSAAFFLSIKFPGDRVRPP